MAAHNVNHSTVELLSCCCVKEELENLVGTARRLAFRDSMVAVHGDLYEQKKLVSPITPPLRKTRVKHGVNGREVLIVRDPILSFLHKIELSCYFSPGLGSKGNLYLHLKHLVPSFDKSLHLVHTTPEVLPENVRGRKRRARTSFEFCYLWPDLH